MQLFGERSHQTDVPMVLTMSTTDDAILQSGSRRPEARDPDNRHGSSLLHSSPPPRPDSLNMDGWCIVSEAALTKEMLQHIHKPEEIASLAASYLTRQLFAILEDSLEPLLVDQIFKALQDISEVDAKVLRNFIEELNEEQDKEEHPHLSLFSNDNECPRDDNRYPRVVIKVLLDLLRFSPLPVEHNILWVRLLSRLSHPPHDLATFIDLKVAATVLGTMSAHTNSAQIQEHGCRVLEPLAKFRPTPFQKAPVRESGIQVLLRTLETHLNDATIVAGVCLVLANLTCTMSQFTSWAVQQGYPDDEAEKLVMVSMEITDYIKENGLTLLDRAIVIWADNIEIQNETTRIMACFGYHSPLPSSEDASPTETGHRKPSILKSLDSPRPTCPQRRVTFSYDLDTRVEYQCSDSESDIGPEEPKRHTVCGGEMATDKDIRGEAFFLEGEARMREDYEMEPGLSKADRKLSFPNFKMEGDYLKMWEHILGEGLFSSICYDLAQLERDFDKTGSSSSKSSSCETLDLAEYSHTVDDNHPYAKQSLNGPCKSLPSRNEARPDRGAARSRFATVPAYRHDFFQPNWQVQDTDSAIRNRLSIESATLKTKKRPVSEPSKKFHFDLLPEEGDVVVESEDEGLETADDKTFTEYSEIDIIEALVRSGMLNADTCSGLPTIKSHDLDKTELENKGNEEKENQCLSRSEKTESGVSTLDTTLETSDQSFDPNSISSHADPLDLDFDLLPIDEYLENKSLADDILSSFGIFRDGTTQSSPLEPIDGKCEMFSLPGMSNGCSDTDDVFFNGATMGDCYSSGRSASFIVKDRDILDLTFGPNESTIQDMTQPVFSGTFDSLHDTSSIFRSSLASSPTSSVSSASLSYAEWSDLEALNEEEGSMLSMDTVTTQDTPPNSETEMNSYHTMPKQKKINFMHRFSERKPQNYPPPKPRRTWYYRSSADVRKSLVKSCGVEVDAVLGLDCPYATVSKSPTRVSKRGLNLLAFSKTSTNMSFDSGVVTGDDEEGPSTVSCRDSYPVGHDYEEVYMSKTELKPTLYERLSRKGHYAEVKKAKVQVKGESSSEATYAVCTLWVNKNCVEALVTFDHLTKQLLSPYSIVPAVRQLEGVRKMSLGDSLDVIEASDYPAWTSILNVLATEENKWTLSLAAQVLPIIDRLFYTKDEAIMDASVGLVQLLIRKFGHEIEKHHSGGLFRTRFRDDCRTCFMWLSKLYSRVSDLMKRDSRREDDLDSLLHLALLSSLRESLKAFNSRISRGVTM
ncbi:uncharacterized protein LOC117302549 isoform X3 [Asterias rubens]|uniref:uncharacterized protein LOC117302549 isoform X3 n=1 Tax=Asterias rubens TaxID=7604 RepID=UPI001455CE95|nr:uncharacterized protein LOC117302549 isoform X3 [Asterias rubens]